MLGKKTGEDRNDQFVQHDTLWERGCSTHRLIVQVDSEAPSAHVSIRQLGECLAGIF